MLMWDRQITQTALGETIGMNQSHLGKRLRGNLSWSATQLTTIAAALKTSVAYLMGEVDDPTWCAPRDLNPEPID
ncbi:two-component system sensor protein [Leifsonia xyli subsp. cynodontis DSM 46306]|uniref:HTH cro/C1-type domain-containing protein n=1 Tax=Leifsonia xyli subsp. cynodontis DSM 46306 TaxID=1389489 RepID=U3PC27_LEIXC|nr:two-component system sensor protein [Leifsonia xyli subsp. cynodontis DSM 46306]